MTRRGTALLVAVALLASPPVHPQAATPEPPHGAAATPTPRPPLTRIERRLRDQQLRLPAYARGGDPFSRTPEIPAFTDEVQVTGRPMDTESLTAKMRWWMQEFEPTFAGAPPASFHAPTLAEMREYRPSPPIAADFTPLFSWALGKLTKKDGDKGK